jgi:crotonobetainyl-CoA:carnitine CoA-transferase CaiB-like acyl-CoA transferase
MSGVLSGVKVLDLSWGISGPMATMLLCDQGASVTKIEPPRGDPFRKQWGRPATGYHVWHRGKRSAFVDLKSDSGRDAFLALASNADVIVESFSPGTTARLGIDYDTLRQSHDRLIYCSITAYGRDTADADRPGLDALVMARTGMHWEQRGWPGGSMDRISGHPVRNDHIEAPRAAVFGALRDGPLFPAIPWPSVGACHLAALGVSAALRAREITGRGQWVETSLLQGALACCAMPWLRVANPDAPNFWSWVGDQRAPKGTFQCADGKWILLWPMTAHFVQSVAGGDHLAIPEGVGVSAADDPARIGTGEDDLFVLLYYWEIMADIIRRYPADDWARIAAQADVACQVIRSPEEALNDPSLLADGCVTEVDDPDLGRLREMGLLYTLSKTPASRPGPVPDAGQHTDEIVAEAAATPIRRRQQATPAKVPSMRSPLAGIRVLDLGLAIAGPFGCQVLADLGADVIKINTLRDMYWHSSQISFIANRGKRSLAIDLKDPRGRDALHQLVETADVVHTNMRYAATERLGVDYETLRRIKSDLIYCHTRAFERGKREALPGNDQTGSALAGVQWEDGGLDDGGRPYWSLTSLGDTGNGFLSATAVVQALYHRDRTGEGQFVDTSILYAQLLNCSHVFASTTGGGIERPRLDANNTGLSPRYRIYETSDGWLCIAALTDDQWSVVCGHTGAEDSTELERSFRQRPATEWFSLLDGDGVPCEICSETFALELFDNEEFVKRGWVAHYDHPSVGRVDQPGLLIDFSETPGWITRPPLTVGRESREILREAGYGDEHISALVAEGVVLESV